MQACLLNFLSDTKFPHESKLNCELRGSLNKFEAGDIQCPSSRKNCVGIYKVTAEEFSWWKTGRDYFLVEDISVATALLHEYVKAQNEIKNFYTHTKLAFNQEKCEINISVNKE